MISETESTECSVCYSKHSSHSTHTPLGSGGPILYTVCYLKHGTQSTLQSISNKASRVICMMLGSPLTEYSVHLFKQSIQSCTLPSARKPAYRALCMVILKHSAEYSVWSIQSAYYNLLFRHFYFFPLCIFQTLGFRSEGSQE